MLHKLSRLAEVHNIAVVVSNQLQSQPDDFSAGRDGLRAIGGNVMGHATTYRILLRKAGKVRIAIMVDSPYPIPPYSLSCVRFAIAESTEIFVARMDKLIAAAINIGSLRFIIQNYSS